MTEPTGPLGESIVDAPVSASCDPRIARSKAALREALIELLEERGLDGFTVNDLCCRAGLNRGTFYNHFRSKDDLLATLEGEVLDGIEAFQAKFKKLSIKGLMAYRVRREPLPVLVELFDSLRHEGLLLHALLGPGGDSRFSLMLRTRVCDGFVRSLLHERYQNDSSPLVGYYIAYYSGAYLGVISAWLESGMKESSEEMALIAMRLFFMKPGEYIVM